MRRMDLAEVLLKVFLAVIALIVVIVPDAPKGDDPTA